MGTEWTYTVMNLFGDRVDKIRVMRRVPVALVEGYELSGPMGISRLAWRGGTLFAEVLPNTRVYKPLPMLIAGEPTAHRSWTGVVETMGVSRKAEAELVQKPESIELGTRKYDTEKATITMKLGGKLVELETWYAKGIGPIRQEQRTNGQLDMKIELLGGP